MKYLFVFFSLFLFISCAEQPTIRSLKKVTFSESGYALGLQHGKELKADIAGILAEWKKNTSAQLGKDADLVLKEFFAYAQFDGAIKKWTPDLYEEIRGIAEGSDQKFNDVLLLNLLDEFWVYIDAQEKHHCSAAAAPARNGQPGYISQNMDLENFTDGFQVLMRLNRTDSRPEQLLLTYPGLIVLNGLNEEGVGVCVNTIMQLEASSTGLPVAFVIRRIINSTDKDELLSFLQTVNHASGQNYMLGIRGEVFDFEASANKVVRFNPMNENGSLYHTNHPIANDDIKPGFEAFSPTLAVASLPTNSNSYLRLQAVEKRMTSSMFVNDGLIKEALRSKDNEDNPVCRTNRRNGQGFTFASVIMTFSEKPNLQILAGPPDESEYMKVEFTARD